MTEATHCVLNLDTESTYEQTPLHTWNLSFVCGYKLTLLTNKSQVAWDQHLFRSVKVSDQ